MTLIFDIHPLPAPRPRVTRFGTYNNPKYTAYKKAIGLMAKREIGEQLTGGVKMEIVFQFKKPKSWNKKKKAAAYWHTQPPDTDNCIKGIKDALNGIAYKDDAQICDVAAVKIWGECDMIMVELEEIQ